MADNILTIENLDLRYRTKLGDAEALRDVSIEIAPGETVGIVGESGCGKTTLLKAIMGVMPPNADIEAGRIIFRDTDLVEADIATARKTRWAGIAMVTQSALNALNPVIRVSDQIAEAILAHQKMSKAAVRQRIEELFNLVGVAPSRMDDYPHQFSGGMRQRVLIAMALALEPPVLLADEPTTALDVVVQDQIFRNLRELRERLHFAFVLVTHDLAVVIENCRRIVVMYGGMVVESGPTAAVVTQPAHPYTLGLCNALPDLDRTEDPISIPGRPPELVAPAPGCRFAERCPFALDICRAEMPALIDTATSQHQSRCHRIAEMPTLAAKASRPDIWETTAAAREASRPDPKQ